MATAVQHSVQLTGVPAKLFLESQNHQHDVLRELALIDIGTRFHGDDAQPPERVAALIGEILHEYGDVRAATRQQALSASAAGQETLTIEVPVRPGIVDALRRWLRLVEEVDALCAEGAFLTLAASPEVRALRRWYVEAIADAVAEGSAAAERPYRPAPPAAE